MGTWPARLDGGSCSGAVLGTTQRSPYRLWAIPAGLFVLATLFATYAFGRKREVSDLKQILKGFQDRAGVTPSEDQLDQLGQLIMRSQRNFKELIDSLDDAAMAISLDGTLRTVNRRAAELLGASYSDLVGHKLSEFLGAPLHAESQAACHDFSISGIGREWWRFI